MRPIRILSSGKKADPVCFLAYEWRRRHPPAHQNQLSRIARRRAWPAGDRPEMLLN